MGRLVKIHNGDICIAHEFVATPTYKIYRSNYSDTVPPPHGWKFFSDNVDIEDFAPLWTNPEIDEEGYSRGSIVQRNNARYVSISDGNVKRPGKSPQAENNGNHRPIHPARRNRHDS